MVFAAHTFFFLLAASLLRAQCTLPEIAPGAIDRLSPDQLVASGHYLRAIRTLEPLPQDGHIAWLLSRSKAATGDLDAAVKLAEAAVASDESNPAYHVQLAAVEGQIAQHSGLLKQLSFARKAKKEIDTAIELEPSNAIAQWGEMMFYFAAPALIGGDKAKAQSIGERMAVAQPQPGRYYQGRLAMEMKDFVKAEDFYKQAIIEDPLSFDNVAALANFYIEQKPNQARAERWACVAVHVDPTRADAWALLAKTKAMCGCWTEAVAMAERSEAIDPDDLAPWYALAQVATTRGEQLERASAWLRKYLDKPANGDPESTTEPARAALQKLQKERR